jgi:hypothetical protein
LIGKALDVASQTFTVIFTVNLLGTSIGAGFQVIRSKVTFRDLSTSIDSGNHRGQRRLRISVGHGNDQEGLASNALSYCRVSLFRPQFYRHGPGAVTSLSASDGLLASNPLRPIIDPGCGR